MSEFQFNDALKLWLSKRRECDLTEIVEAELFFEPGYPAYSEVTPGAALSCDILWRSADGEQHLVEIDKQEMGLFIRGIAACAWETRNV